jgi:hypothetical protein
LEEGELLFSRLLLTACTSPSPAGPVVAISGPIVDATTDTPVVADVYVDGTRNVTAVNNSIT